MIVSSYIFRFYFTQSYSSLPFRTFNNTLFFQIIEISIGCFIIILMALPIGDVVKGMIHFMDKYSCRRKTSIVRTIFCRLHSFVW